MALLIINHNKTTLIFKCFKKRAVNAIKYFIINNEYVYT